MKLITKLTKGEWASTLNYNKYVHITVLPEIRDLARDLADIRQTTIMQTVKDALIFLLENEEKS
jgi:hypothetical protein